MFNKKLFSILFIFIILLLCGCNITKESEIKKVVKSALPGVKLENVETIDIENDMKKIYYFKYKDINFYIENSYGPDSSGISNNSYINNYIPMVEKLYYKELSRLHFDNITIEKEFNEFDNNYNIKAESYSDLDNAVKYIDNYLDIIKDYYFHSNESNRIFDVDIYFRIFVGDNWIHSITIDLRNVNYDAENFLEQCRKEYEDEVNKK